MKLSLGLTPRDYSVAGSAVAYDTDAQAYFTANTAITSSADKNAMNTFYLGLKSDGIYTKIKAMYLPVWGSAASCKWNLVNPLDTDAAYRLNFSTGWTFSSGGITPTNAYADTFLVPSTNLILQNNHFSYYSRTSGNPSASQIFIGVDGLSGLYNNKAVITLGYTNSGLAYSTQHSEAVITDQAVSPTQSTRLGFWMNSRTSSTATTLKIFKNGNSLANATTSTAGQQLNTGNIFIAARNNTTLPGAANFTNCQCSFASIGDGLTDAEASNFYTRVNTLMTYFGINV